MTEFCWLQCSCVPSHQAEFSLSSHQITWINCYAYIYFIFRSPRSINDIHVRRITRLGKKQTKLFWTLTVIGTIGTNILKVSNGTALWIVNWITTALSSCGLWHISHHRELMQQSKQKDYSSNRSTNSLHSDICIPQPALYHDDTVVVLKVRCPTYTGPAEKHHLCSWLFISCTKHRHSPISFQLASPPP